MTIFAWVLLVFAAISFLFSIFIALQLNVFTGTMVLALSGAPTFYYVSYLFLNIPDVVQLGFAIGVAIFYLIAVIRTLVNQDSFAKKLVVECFLVPHIVFCAINILNYFSII